jgi:aspartate/methionine/tyrosine aminotransferase
LPSISIEKALAAISPDSIGIASGAAGILNSLFFLLGDGGDAALIPRPYYSAFDSDMSLVAEITPFGFSLARPTQGPTESELDMAYLEARSQGLNPRFLLLTNPNNPLATIYRPEVIQNAITWARKRKMHTIVDEIYALSAPQDFQSVLRIMDGQLGDDVHMVWSLSKDFGASGLRVGFVLSGNKGTLKLNSFALY